MTVNIAKIKWQLKFTGYTVYQCIHKQLIVTGKGCPNGKVLLHGNGSCNIVCLTCNNNPPPLPRIDCVCSSNSIFTKARVRTKQSSKLLVSVTMPKERRVAALLPRAREACTRGRVIGVSGCLFVCVFVDTKTSSLSETGQFMSSTYYVPVRNRKILASTHLTNESVRQ